MAKSTIKRLISLTPFSLALLFMLTLILVTVAAIFKNFDIKLLSETLKDEYIIYIIRSNLWQAFISSFLAIILAIPIARALHRRSNFFGRKLIINFINISFALPSITLVLGIIIIHGKNGWINNFMNFFFDASFNYYLYGMFGVVMAHLSFCLPLATRTFLNCLGTIPQETWKVSSQLNLSAWKIFKYIELPAIRPAIVSIAIFIFIICFTSFVIILSLGRGPIVTSLEVSIYQAIKVDFNLSQAAILALIQLIICLCLVLVAQKFNTQIFSFHLSKTSPRTSNDSFSSKLIDLFFLFMLFITSILPVIGIFKNGFNSKLIDILYSTRLFFCLQQSLLIAVSSSIIALVMAFSLISGAFYFNYYLNKPKLAEKVILLGSIRLMIPIFIFATGLFLTIGEFTYMLNHAFLLLSIGNAIASLPFVINILWPDALNFKKEEINLCKQLNINYWNFIKFIYYPRTKKNFGYALSFAIAISWGDLGLIALFSSKDLNTLPNLLYTMLSNYRIEEAATIALIIILLSFFFFWIIEELWSGDQDARA